MSVAVLFDAFIRAEYISRSLQWEIRQALVAAAANDESAAWAAVLEHCNGSVREALEWLEDNDFIEYDRGGLGVRVQCRVAGQCDTCWVPVGGCTIILPDGTQVESTFDCCGWYIEDGKGD